MPLTDFTAYRVARLAHRMRAAADEALAPLGLTVKLFGALLALHDAGPQTQRALGVELGIDRTTMVGFVDDLERAGHVARRRDPQDRRANLIELTRPGRTALQKAQRRLAAIEEELLAPLSARERRAFSELLARLTDSLDR